MPHRSIARCVGTPACARLLLVATAVYGRGSGHIHTNRPSRSSKIQREHKCRHMPVKKVHLLSAENASSLQQDVPCACFGRAQRDVGAASLPCVCGQRATCCVFSKVSHLISTTACSHSMHLRQSLPHHAVCGRRLPLVTAAPWLPLPIGRRSGMRVCLVRRSV